MKINVIATGSSGNLYELLDNSGNSIIIEAGMTRHTYTKFREASTPPEMCIVSHKHSDHAQHIGEFQAVIPTYLMADRAESENFKVMGFPLIHGDGVSYGYLIKLLTENRFVFFATDFELPDNEMKYSSLFQALEFYKVDIYMIECNYNDYLYHLANEQQRIGCDRHLSDNDVVRFMRLAKVVAPKIITIHGSNRLSADTYTKKYIESKLTGSRVGVATGVKGGQKNIFII